MFYSHSYNLYLVPGRFLDFRGKPPLYFNKNSLAIDMIAANIIETALMALITLFLSVFITVALCIAVHKALKEDASTVEPENSDNA